MLEIKLKEIYKTSKFNFYSKRIIHSTESATSICNKHETISLLNRKLLKITLEKDIDISI